MESLNTRQWHMFWVSCAIVAFVLCARIVPLLPLYMDTDLRDRTRVMIRATAEREGWLLSGVSIRRVSRNAVDVQYRSFVRGHDSAQCYSIHLSTGSLSPCDAL